MSDAAMAQGSEQLSPQAYSLDSGAGSADSIRALREALRKESMLGDIGAKQAQGADAGPGAGVGAGKAAAVGAGEGAAMDADGWNTPALVLGEGDWGAPALGTGASDSEDGQQMLRPSMPMLGECAAGLVWQPRLVVCCHLLAQGAPRVCRGVTASTCQEAGDEDWARACCKPLGC